MGELPKMPHHLKPRWQRWAEIFFGGIAKGTMAIVVVTLIIISVLSGSPPNVDLPSTRKEWLYFFCGIAFFCTAVAIALHYGWTWFK